MTSGGGHSAVVMPAWSPDRGIRRTTLTLGAAAVVLIGVGAAADTMWLLGIGVWAVIAATMIELVYRP
ncbi:hypothetical protein [Streptomyces sp. NBC_00467]|uniref:hypothetical protein n=1 Tax=Streptomyces sp. NBC_00467 TaxID=2975752 RepID=UPI002E191506